MQELLIGDPAPDIRLAEFLKGEPLSVLEVGTVHVLELWATWCGPCRASIPRLSELRDKFPQAVFLGVAVLESSVEEVRTFVSEMGNQIRYRIAIEEPLSGSSSQEGGFMTKHWLEASYQRGIPTAFIVDALSRIAWVGHPIEIEEPLTAILDGYWDLTTKARQHRERLDKNHIRQAFRLSQALKPVYATGNSADVATFIGKAIAADPFLEPEFGPRKLHALMKDPASRRVAQEYATRLIDGACRDDAQALLVVSVLLFEPSKTPARRDGPLSDVDFANLAVRAMSRIEIMLSRDESSAAMMPHVRMQYEEHFARALLTTRNVTEALRHAERACHSAREAGVSGDFRAKMEILRLQCQGVE